MPFYINCESLEQLRCTMLNIPIPVYAPRFWHKRMRKEEHAAHETNINIDLCTLSANYKTLMRDDLKSISKPFLWENFNCKV